MEAALDRETVFCPEPPLLAGIAPPIARLRRSAFERFERLGFPQPKNEAWRYTGLQPITGINWGLARRPPRLSCPPDGVRVWTLSRAARDLPADLSSIAPFEENAFAALNTAFLEEAVIVEIAAGAVVADPVEIVFDTPEAEHARVSHPRVLILAGRHSQAAVVEAYSGAGHYFTNAVTEILVGEGALLEHSKLQQESAEAAHVHTVAARQERDSHFTSNNVALGGALARTDVRVTLADEGAECTLNGLFLGAGTQHIDNHTWIDHARPHGVSRELYKGIMDGGSRGVFHGTIIVRPGAQKTDAMQTNKNLLLSRRALVNSTPALEIFADDVKCKHGSTTGQLDPEALFYLRSRGLDEDAARSLLTFAFASDVADRLRVPRVRAAVEEAIAVRLGGARVPEVVR